MKCLVILAIFSSVSTIEVPDCVKSFGTYFTNGNYKPAISVFLNESTWNLCYRMLTSCYITPVYNDDVHMYKKPFKSVVSGVSLFYNLETYYDTTIKFSGLLPDSSVEIGGSEFIYQFSQHTATISGIQNWPNPIRDFLKTPVASIFDSFINVGSGFMLSVPPPVKTGSQAGGQLFPPLLFSEPTLQQGASGYSLLIMPYKHSKTANSMNIVVQYCNFTFCPGYFILYQLGLNTPPEFNGKDFITQLLYYDPFLHCKFKDTFSIPASSAASVDSSIFNNFLFTFNQLGINIYSNLGDQLGVLKLLYSFQMPNRITHLRMMPYMTMLADGALSTFDSRFYFSRLTQQEYLLRFDKSGELIEYANCKGSYLEQAYCIQGTFNLPAGVYELSVFNQPVGDPVAEYRTTGQCDAAFSEFLNADGSVIPPDFYVNKWFSIQGFDNEQYDKYMYGGNDVWQELNNVIHTVTYPYPTPQVNQSGYTSFKNVRGSSMYEFGRDFLMPKITSKEFVGCSYNATYLRALFELGSVACSGITLDQLVSNCYGGISLQYFPIVGDPLATTFLDPTSENGYKAYTYAVNTKQPYCVIRGKMDPNTHPWWKVQINPGYNTKSCYGASNYQDCMFQSAVGVPDEGAGVNDASKRYANLCYKTKAAGYSCGHTFGVRTAFTRKVLDCENPYAVTPGGIPAYEDESCGPRLLNQKENGCNFDTLYRKSACALDPTLSDGRWGGGWAMVLTITPTAVNQTSGAMTCPQEKQDLPPIEHALGKCVTYDLLGVTGRGVITLCNATMDRGDSPFVYDYAGSLIGFWKGSRLYCIKSCVTTTVAVVVPANATIDTDPNLPLIYRDVLCSDVNVTGVDTVIGCVINAVNDTTKYCSGYEGSIGQSLCIESIDKNRVARDVSATQRTYGIRLLSLASLQSRPIFNGTISVATSYSFVSSTQFLQTFKPKISVDCKAYVCNGFSECENLLVQYGSFCNDINKALSGASLKADSLSISLFEAMQTSASSKMMTLGAINMSAFFSTSDEPQTRSGRSFIEDLLFDKVTVADPGFMQAYDECVKAHSWEGGGFFVSPEDAEPMCIQRFNGLQVLPPIMSTSLITKLSAGLSMSTGIFGTLTLGLLTPATGAFVDAIASRINGLGITTNVLMENQKEIANKFNHALSAVQAGFTATNDAIRKMQDVVNSNAQVVNKLVEELNNNFGAISSALADIVKRVDGLERNAQIDRLINGRLAALQAYVSQSLVQLQSVESQSQLAVQIINECVKSQSLRAGFCGGLDKHVYSLVQNAPNGLLFVHMGLKYENFTTIDVAVGLCVSLTTSGEEQLVGITPKSGIFTTSCDGFWQITSAAILSCENITLDNVVVGTCNVNYTFTNLSISNGEIPMFNKSFLDELQQYLKNHTTVLPSLEIKNLTASVVDLAAELQTLQDVVKKLNESYINLQELGKYEHYIKWPWYYWLGFIAGIVGLILAVVMILCATSCCSCFKGICSCGGCCGKSRSHYFDDDDFDEVKLHLN